MWSSDRPVVDGAARGSAANVRRLSCLDLPIGSVTESAAHLRFRMVVCRVVVGEPLALVRDGPDPAAMAGSCQYA
jgi:hypothetical protein